MDHTDGFVFTPAPEGAEAEVGAETDEELGMPAAGDETSDEEMEAAEAAGEVAAPPPVLPRRRRLSYKQPAPAAYQVPPEGDRRQKVLKQPGMRKRPASTRGNYRNELCRNYRGMICQFSPQNPGQPARVQPNRGVERCIFCDRDRMREAHAVSRRAPIELFRHVVTTPS